MIDFSLYVIIDNNYFHNAKSLIKIVQKVCEGGANIIQLREKNTGTKAFLKYALLVRKITKEFKIPFIVNDRVDIAIASKADGVHLGDNDLPIHYAKKIFPNGIIGSSANTVIGAIESEKAGADYLGVGCLFPSKTKLKPITSLNMLSKIKANVSIPVLGIGGITLSNIENVLSTGADGVCVANGILGHTNIKTQTQKFRIKLSGKAK